MFTHVDHIGIAVHDLEQAIAMYRDSFGIEEWERIDLADRHMAVGVARFGETLIELIAPTSEQAAFTKFLAERGPGIHHVAYRVDDIEATLAMLRERGVKLIDQQARPGIHNTLVAFVHPKATMGTLIEIVQHTHAH